MEYHSKLTLLLFAVILLNTIHPSQSCYGGHTSTSISDGWFVISYNRIVQGGLTCNDMWNYYQNPDTNFYSGHWYLFYNQYSNSDYRFGFQDPYAGSYSYEMLANFTEADIYYPIYHSVFDINTTNTDDVFIYSHISNYQSVNRHTTVINFEANISRALVNTSLCSEGKCNYFKIDGFEPISGRYNVTNSFIPGVSDYMWDKIKLNASFGDIYYGEASIFTQYSIWSNPFLPEQYTAIKPTLLDTLIYVINAPEPKQYGIFVDYNSNKYLITAGLSDQESFYSDASLRHYIDCNITDTNTTMRSIFIHASGVNYYFDVGAFCGQSSASITINDSTDLFGCGVNIINKTGTFNYTVYGNSTKSIEIYYMNINSTWNSIATTGVYEYNLTDTTEVHIYCEDLEVASSFETGKGTINSGRTILLLVAFMIILGILFITNNFGYAVVLVYMAMFALSSVGLLSLDYGYIVGVLIIGALLYYIMNFKFNKKGGS